MYPAELGHQAVRGGISALGHLYLAVRPATASVNLIFVEKRSNFPLSLRLFHPVFDNYDPADRREM